MASRRAIRPSLEATCNREFAQKFSVRYLNVNNTGCGHSGPLTIVVDHNSKWSEVRGLEESGTSINIVVRQGLVKQ